MSNARQNYWGRAMLCGLALGAAGCGGHLSLGEDQSAGSGGTLNNGAGGTGGRFNLPTAGSGNVANASSDDGITPFFELPTCNTEADANTWIAFDTDRDDFDRELYMMHPDGSGVARLTEHPGIDEDPAFSGDGRWISFTSDRAGSTQIYLFERATGDVTQLTNRAEGADQSAFSHDGTLVAFHSGSATYTIGVDGSNERRVLESLDGLSAYGRPQFMPDDQRLLVDRYNQIDTVALDGDDLRSIVKNTTTRIQGPSPSPSGVDVAYAVACFFDQPSIWATPYSLSSELCKGLRLTPPDEIEAESPSWGPSDRIAYTRVDRHNNTGQIAIVAHERGAMPCAATPTGADNRNPSWSPAVP